VKLAGKPGSVVGSHSSGPYIAERLKPPTRKLGGTRQRLPIWCCSRWRLPCHSCCHERGALLPHLFTLTWSGVAPGHRRFDLCGPVPRLAADGRYPSPFPVEPGLSSACGTDDWSRPLWSACSGCLASFGAES